MKIRLIEVEAIPEEAIAIGSYDPDGRMPKLEGEGFYLVGEIFDLSVTKDSVWMTIHRSLSVSKHEEEFCKVLGIKDVTGFARAEVEDRVAKARKRLAEWEETLAAVERL